MKAFNLAAAAVLALAAATPAMAQSSTATSGHPSVRHPGPNQPNGGSPGYQANTYVRRPSSRTPTDVGNMAFPDPSQSPSGSLNTVPVGR